VNDVRDKFTWFSRSGYVSTKVPEPRGNFSTFQAHPPDQHISTAI